MRMRDQLVVVIALAVAIIAVAGNVFAQTRAADQRAEIEREGINAAWSYPVMDATASVSRDAEASAAEDEGTRSTDSSAEPCSDAEPCTIEDVLDHDFRNHGQMVSAYVHALGFEEGLDGPRGSFVRQIAKPDIENDGPPRSDRAAENQAKKDNDTPPGQDKKDNDTPPGQDKKDKDG